MPQSEDRAGLYCGPYEAGGVWVVFDGSGTVRVAPQRAVRGVTGLPRAAYRHPGAYRSSSTTATPRARSS